MKILFVVNNFNFGGPQKALLNLLYELENCEVELFLVSLNGRGSLTRYVPDYVKILKLKSKYALLTLNKKNFSKHFFQNIIHPILLFKSIKAIYEINKNQNNNAKIKQAFWIDNKFNELPFSDNFDYVIGVSSGHSIYFARDNVKANVKLGWIRTDYNVLKRNNKMDNEYFSDIDGFISVSNKCKEIFLDIFGDKNVKTFYNPLPLKLYDNIPDANFIKDNNKYTIATICRLDKDKGLDLLIESAKIIKEQKLNIEWIIVGEGKLNDWLLNEIKNNGLQEIVKPIGFHINTGSIIKKIDLLVHPSRYEGKSNTIDEALLFNKPVLATNFSTVEEQINHRNNGIIVEMDPNSIFQEIKKFYLGEYKFDNLKKKEINKGEEFLQLLNDFNKGGN